MSTATANVSVVLIEDNRVLRDGIAAMLRSDGITVVASLRYGDEALRVIEQAQPAVVLLGCAAANGDASARVGAVKLRAPECNIIVTDVLPGHAEIAGLIAAGASGFVLSDATLDDILSAIRSVTNGINVLPAVLTSAVFAHVAKQRARVGRDARSAARLTPREQQVVELIGHGLSNKEMAGRLHISPDTVKNHVHTVLEKLALRTRLEIATYALLDRERP